MATAPASHPELASEQAYIEKVEAAFNESRARARHAAESAGDRHAARQLRDEVMKRLRERVDPDALCFGRIDLENGRRYYLGRGAVHGEAAKLLVINWRQPKAAPFYEAHRGDSRGLTLRRRFQLDRLRLLGIVDDVFGAQVDTPTPEVPIATRAELPTPAPIVDEEVPESSVGTSDVGYAVDPRLTDAILADMNRARGEEMRDIVATIEGRQYELIAEPIDGVLTIQGGPGTGKTAIALHRAAWILFNHRDELQRTGVLVVGPNRAFMEYVAQVLPSLGEESVVQLPVDRLVELDDVRVRATEAPEVARIKGDTRMTEVVSNALRSRVRVPADDVELIFGRVKVRLSATRIAELVADARRRGTSYVAARDLFRAGLVGFARQQQHGDRFAAAHVSAADLESAVTAPNGVAEQIWPTVSAGEILRDLLSSRRRLVAAASGLLDDDEIERLQRDRSRSLRDESWTPSDMPLLDEIEVGLRGARQAFGYVIVDEAQDLSPMQLRMILRRSASRRATLVGDIAQATAPTGIRDWETLLQAAGVGDGFRIAELALGYRLPSQIASLAATLIPRIAPGLASPAAVREGPEEPTILKIQETDLAEVLVTQVRRRLEGERSVGVVAPAVAVDRVRSVLLAGGLTVGDVLTDGLTRQVTVLSAVQAKGLEFDHVVVVEPVEMAGADEDWAYVYIALTRATRTLTILHTTTEPFEVEPESEEPTLDASEILLSGEVETTGYVAGRLVLGAPYTEALMQAKFLYADRYRRGTGVPYLAHLQSVAALVLEDGGGESEAIAALLHDALEDLGSHVLSQIIDQFGVDVARIAVGCRDPEPEEGVSWRQLKTQHMQSLEAAGPQVRRVALAEKLDNARALLRDYRQLGSGVWDRMDVDPDDLLWYQQGLADLFVTERPGDLAWELQDTVERLLDLVSSPEPDGEVAAELTSGV